MLRLMQVLATAAALCGIAASALAQDSGSLAKRFFDSAIGAAKRGGKATGEQFCWVTASPIGHFVMGYEAFGDESFLDYGVQYYDALLDRLAEGPDGYKGWIGRYGYDANWICDVHVGDAILFRGMLEFSELVSRNEGLKKKYGEKASHYVEMARRHLIEKWDSRGTWKEDGPYGGYVAWDRYGEPNEFKDWKRLPGVNGSNLSLPYNKHNDMAQVCMRIYRITGEEKYREKATKIFAFMKSRFQFFDDHYLWNYWEPLGPWDVDLQKKQTRHWMNVHPYRNYQAGEVPQVLEAYHTGIVFDRTDIQRIINTNLKVMWDGNKDKPAFRNSNWNIPGYVKPPPSSQYPTTAGSLWTSLCGVDGTVRDLTAARMRPAESPNPRSQIDLAYFQKVTCKNPPTLDRKYPRLPERPMEFPYSECKALTVACALPANFKAGEKTILLCKSPVSGDVKISLYSADGKKKIAVLNAGRLEGGMDGMKGVYMYVWDGTDPVADREPPYFQGSYRIRWTFQGGHREQPVTIAK